ncbi:primase-helicase family protein [Niveispirillum sp. KHB5.9]|uniref:primase-helicase family protein n=1 Tax=Niveispirillum sp. KHB5.9 TaxID=3400269 RepID=UPI003A83AF50
MDDRRKNYLYVVILHRFLHRVTGQLLLAPAVLNAHMRNLPRRISAAEFFFGPDNPVETVDGVTFSPGQDDIVEEDGLRKANLWVRPAIRPTEGSARPFLDHISYLFECGKVIDAVLNFLAFLVQHPGEKPAWAVLLIGGQGIGKSLLGGMLAKLFGERNVQVITAEQLRSSFNPWISKAHLVVVNEIPGPGDRQAAAQLKSYITDPTITVNEKNIPTYSIRNRASFFLISNEDDAARLDPDDRRFLVWKSKAQKKPGSYYKWLMRWFNQGGAERVLHFLMTRDLADFNPHAAPPRTRARGELAMDSRDDVQAYLQNAFDAGEPPFKHDLVVGNHVINHLNEVRRMKVTPKALSKFFRSIDAVEVGQKRMLDGTKPRVWAIRQHERWKAASEEEIAEAYRTPDGLSLGPPRGPAGRIGIAGRRPRP